MRNRETVYVECHLCNKTVDEPIIKETNDDIVNFCSMGCELDFEDQFIKTYGLDTEELWTK